MQLRMRLRAGLGGAAVAAAALAVAAGSASAASSDPMTAVPQGVNPLAMPGATVFGSTPATTPENVSFVLNMNNKTQLEQQVTNGMKNFLSVRQFASTYGQSQQSINALVSYLGHFGITSTVLADHLVVDTDGTAGAYDAALNVTQEQVSVPAFNGHGAHTGVPAQTVHAPTGAAFLPRSIATSVLSILGLANYSSGVSNAVHAVQLPKSTPSTDPISQAQCAATQGLPLACQTPMDFANRYGLSGLYNRGALGQGETIGIVTLAALDVGAPEFFWQNILGVQPSGRTVNVVNVDGGPLEPPSAAAGSDETDLDTEQSGALAPDANVIVYQSPNTDPGFIDGFAQAASDNIADTVSTSWGESEAAVNAFVAAGEESSAYEASFDEMFLELAAQGQSTFASSGDEGAYDDADEIGSTAPSVDTPADSPYITAAGGTTLPFTGTISDSTTGLTAPLNSGNAERAWGWDYLWGAIASTNQVPLATVATNPQFTSGDGGGFSTVEPQPSYQRFVPGTNLFSQVEYLTPTNVQNIVGNLNEPVSWDFNPNPRTTFGFGFGRAVPDVSTDADPESGYLLFSPVLPQAGLLELQPGFGGTSFVSPQLNGSTAVIDSFVGHRVGFWNPSIYGFATRFGSPFKPLDTPGTSNDNLLFSGTPGTLYNPASGLGVPNLAALGQDFANAGRGRGGF